MNRRAFLALPFVAPAPVALAAFHQPGKPLPAPNGRKGIPDWLIRAAIERADAVSGLANIWHPLSPPVVRELIYTAHTQGEIFLLLDSSTKEGFRSIDPATIKVLVDPQGWQPEPPSPAFLQVLSGGKIQIQVTKDQMLHFKRYNYGFDKKYGHPPSSETDIPSFPADVCWLKASLLSSRT